MESNGSLLMTFWKVWLSEHCSATVRKGGSNRASTGQPSPASSRPARLSQMGESGLSPSHLRASLNVSRLQASNRWRRFVFKIAHSTTGAYVTFLLSRILNIANLRKDILLRSFLGGALFKGVSLPFSFVGWFQLEKCG